MTYDIVFFGATGDLTWRKLMPALFEAFRHGGAPQGGRILGVAREARDTDGYRELLWERFQGLGWDTRPDRAEFDRFAQTIEYQRFDITDRNSFSTLAAWIGQRDADAVVMYLATAPNLFVQACEGLAAVGLNESRVRVVLEKPLGHDLASAREINDAVRRLFTERQIFRIDHYLGKQSVQNLMALRFGNALFEPLWRREAIADVQITIAEDLGVEGRGGYYERSGALRDMMQNHLLQLLCIVAMEPPASNDADSIRDEKLKVLRCLKRFNPGTVSANVVRGQYRAGVAGGVAVPGYLEEPGVDPDSHTETFVAVRTEIENWRWAGVPFLLRTGKRLGTRGAEIVINFRPVPHPIFEGTEAPARNRLVISLQPDDTIELHLLAKASNRAKAEQGRLVPVKLDLDFRQTFGTQTIEAYERLLRKVIAGRLDLFVRFDEQMAAWEWVAPILDAWAQDPTPPRPYSAGSWGPPGASALAARDGSSWPEEL
ncbi:MAG: glucose-6-phosphate dehydrogenase [Betaproteobacteria bacterium]|nr:glucose-6-phosphate dehydrogenase [Betaproteobacteria bacterium]